MGVNRLLRRPSYRVGVTIVYVMGVFIQILDATVVNVALPAIGRDFNVPSDQTAWVVLGYLLTYTIAIPLSGWLADTFGGKRAFMLALAGFVLASILCGLSGTLNQLIAARMLQGLPAGLITPIGATILFRAYPQRDRAKAAAAMVGVVVVGPAIGPVLGGIITDTIGWPWIFFVNIPMGTAALVLAGFWLRNEPVEGTGSLDLVGFALAGVGLAGVLYATSVGSRQGWLGWQTLTSLAVGVAALFALVTFELRQDAPLVDFRLFGGRHFRFMNLTSFAVFAGFMGLIYLIPQYVQEYRGFSATSAGLTQTPQAVGIFVVSNSIARRLYQAYGPRRLLALGALATFVVSAAFALVGPDTSLVLLGFGTFLRGCAMGILFVTVQTAVYATTSHAETAKAVTLFSTQRQLANAIGVAVAATTLTTLISSGMTLNAYRIAFAASATMFIPGVVWAWRINDADAAATRGLEPAGAS